MTKAVVNVYKDGWIASRPWCADVKTPDGKIYRAWQSGFRTKKAMMENIEAAMACVSEYGFEVIQTKGRIW